MFRLLVPSPKWPQWLEWTRPRARSSNQDLAWVQGPRHLAVSGCLPRALAGSWVGTTGARLFARGWGYCSPSSRLASKQ